MQSNRNAVELEFGKLLDDARTLLPVSTAVTYTYTLPCAALVKHTPHPAMGDFVKCFCSL